jgi:hypothetical protein
MDRTGAMTMVARTILTGCCLLLVICGSARGQDVNRYPIWREKLDFVEQRSSIPVGQVIGGQIARSSSDIQTSRYATLGFFYYDDNGERHTVKISVSYDSSGGRSGRRDSFRILIEDGKSRPVDQTFETHQRVVSVIREPFRIVVDHDVLRGLPCRPETSDQPSRRAHRHPRSYTTSQDTIPLPGRAGHGR